MWQDHHARGQGTVAWSESITSQTIEFRLWGNSVRHVYFVDVHLCAVCGTMHFLPNQRIVLLTLSNLENKTGFC
jgi:hypothetical protein